MPRPSVPVAGVKRYRVKGVWYCYHRRTGERIREDFGCADFFIRLRALDAKADAAEAARRPAHGSLKAVMESYRRSPAFTQLAARTRSDYQKVMDYLAPIDGTIAATITRGWCAKLRDKAFEHRGRRFANYVTSVLSILLGHAVDMDLLKDNPAFKMKKVRKSFDAEDDGARPWTVGEIHAVLDALSPELRAPFAIMAYTGLRIGDVITLSRSAYDGAQLRHRTRKRKVLAHMAVAGPLRAILDAAPTGTATTLCVSSRGRPWTYAGLMSSWRRVRIRLEETGRIGLGLSPHGLRHSVAVILREAGYSDRAIADMLAQEDAGVALDYAREATLVDLNASAARTVARRLKNGKQTDGV